MVRAAVLISGLALAACAHAAPAPPPAAAAVPPPAYGEGIARRSCGGCHAVADGPSPLPAAPPFRDLHRRYPAGGLAQRIKPWLRARTVARLRDPLGDPLDGALLLAGLPVAALSGTSTETRASSSKT